ncbi:hypothetical protein LI073_02680 [bacterium 210917-SL.2.15]|nr:hypothetical protein [bacterium 210917-SL.2.15]
MIKIEDILDIPCKLLCEEDGTVISFDGVLTRKEQRIIFTGRTTDDTDSFHEKLDLTLYGEIDTTPITLLNSMIKSSSSRMYSKEHVVKIEASEIIIGRSHKCKEKDILVQKISTTIVALNYMFNGNFPVELVYNFSKENPALANFTYPPKLQALDVDGKLELYQTISMGRGINNAKITFIPCVDYTFTAPTSIRKAISKIASARNLFSFFSDYYLPLENLTFSDNQSKMIDFCDCSVYLNSFDNINTPDRPFLISTNDFFDDFDTVWKKWCDFYSSMYIPTLFYEVICNRSSRINGFLNFAQAIEIFSSHYRNEEATKLSIVDKWKSPRLKHRFKDIITFLNVFYNLAPDEIDNLAQTLSDARNFFTHYEKKTNYEIPSVQELFAASRVLHFMLLALVYRTISIKDSSIEKAAKMFSYGSLSRDIQVVLKKIDIAQHNSMFE